MFFERYSALCSKAGKSPNKVAKELSISSGSVTEWKKGRIPQNATVSKIAKYFDVSTDYLLGRTDEKKERPREWGGELRKHFSKERCSQTAMPFFAVFELYFGLFLSPVQNQMHR